MTTNYAGTIAGELSLRPDQVQATATLLAEGATVPFIARYRKERTGSLDEVSITQIRDRLKQLQALSERREAIVSSLLERDLLTEDLQAAIASADTMTDLEDLYLPYKPKRRTRAMIARERGLEPLADLILSQDEDADPLAMALAFVDEEKGLETVDQALAGARDILAERVNESARSRGEIRRLFEKRGILRSHVVEGKEEDGATYRDYFDWEEPLAQAPAHRIHAMLRAEREGVIRLSARPDEEAALSYLKRQFVTHAGPAAEQVSLSVEDGYKRLMAPSIENEIRAQLKQKADREAVRVFAANLQELLMASPLGQKRILGVDPGFRTGCKLVCLDAQGKLLTHDVAHITGSDKQRAAARETFLQLVKDYEIDAIAIGNGTASRETEAFVRKLDLGRDVMIVLVNESGASVYSASEIARQEFPDHDVTVRGAVSIGRRLMDPLAELVKIDPKSIGVGQYQHDVDQARLKSKLDDVVESCVNAVGVEVNTASKELLSYVSGLGLNLAANIVAYRNDNGPFQSRKDLKKVPRLGAKAFEQAAGFLRIRDGINPLDASAVHPERYSMVKQMAADLGCSIGDLISDESLRSRIDLKLYISDSVGMPTLKDILVELARPGRDPRSQFEVFSFAEGINSIEDLDKGMELPGIVTNVTKFGAFVDIGVHQDGLVHISQLADRFVKDPHDVIKVNQKVKVRVLEVDTKRKRISLSMRKADDSARRPEGLG